MTARIYKPSRTAMQSGQARTKAWVLQYEPEKPRTVEPLMGYTTSSDMLQQVTLSFDTKEEAIAYCTRHGIAYRVQEPKERTAKRMSYSDNFKFNRAETWTH
ncbi:ETC complex I subunit [Mongoliimonas terrestris]|uniref:ETC complex I subunit n=1 Tax=Mongoliimonas terrestris TaxID=1709001 RepID=UPI0009497664|nr:ETC complex I subunit [Mongoliimonas terrestris]